VIQYQLDIEQCKSLMRSKDITALEVHELIQFFYQEKSMAEYLPEEQVVQDPRSFDYIVYNSKRAVRPTDNHTEPNANSSCVICSGKTTGNLDLIHLSEGFTFINKNLFPILFPHKLNADIPQTRGFHLLQWTSSIHENDWLNMPLDDLKLVVKRMAAVEGYLISHTDAIFPRTKKGYVSIIKNYGRKVGGSLKHDHQQIGFSNIMPRRVKDNLAFQAAHKKTFPEFLLTENSGQLTIKDYGPAVLVVPYYMQRPLYMTLVLKDTDKNFLYELSDEELEAVTEGWRDAIYVINSIMPELGKETAYNIISNTHAGIYFDFLPYTQEFGGFEHLGLFLCQMTPEQAAVQIRKTLHERSCEE